MVFGLKITEVTTLSNQSVAQDRYRQMIIVGTSTTDVTYPNKITEVKDLNDFVAKFGSGSASYPYFRFIFNNDDTRQNIYYFVNGKGAGTPTDKENLLAGINVISSQIEFEPSVVIVPEAFVLSGQSDRTEIYTALQTLAGNKKHLNFFNTGLSTDTKIEAITERSLYQSTSGDSSLYYEFYEDLLGAFIPLALHAGVIQLVRGIKENPYEPPSGINYPAQGIKGLRNNNIIVSESDYNDFQNNNINIAVLIPKGKYCLWISRTLATDDRWININTRVAATITKEKLKVALLPFLQQAADPRGERARNAERRCYDVMDQQFELGALTSDAPGDRSTAYKITLTPNTTGNTRTTTIQIQARLVQTLELIEVTLVNVGKIV